MASLEMVTLIILEGPDAPGGANIIDQAAG